MNIIYPEKEIEYIYLAQQRFGFQKCFRSELSEVNFEGFLQSPWSNAKGFSPVTLEPTRILFLQSTSFKDVTQSTQIWGRNENFPEISHSYLYHQ